MIPEALDKIEAADIHALVTDGDEERRTIDFMVTCRASPTRTRTNSAPMRSSFANAAGGDLIFGVRRGASRATAVLGLGDSSGGARSRWFSRVVVRA